MDVLVDSSGSGSDARLGASRGPSSLPALGATLSAAQLEKLASSPYVPYPSHKLISP